MSERYALARINLDRGLLDCVDEHNLALLLLFCASGDNVSGGEWHTQRVGDAWASRAAAMASALQCMYMPDVSAAGRPTVSQWPVTSSITSCFLT